MDIYTILSSKQNNAHYLRRYCNFIEACENSNENLDESVYTEIHHICPKANDLFPEYASFSKNPWNKVTLTARQHIIAHVMLWKAYPSKLSQSKTVDCMLGNFNSDTNRYLAGRKVPTSLVSRYLAKSRQEAAIARTVNVIGKTTYKDENGNNYFLTKEDPLIEELGLVHFKLGSKQPPESFIKYAETMFLRKYVFLYFLNMKKKVKLLSDEYATSIEEGWNTKRTEEDLAYIRKLSRVKSAQKIFGRTKYMTPDGVYFGQFYPSDPRIEEFSLIKHVTDKQTAQRAGSFQKGAAEANLGSTIYNNGEREEKFKEHPGEGWTEGRLPRTEEHYAAQLAGIKAKVVGTNTYNDGVSNFFVKPGDFVDPSWKKGMKPQKPREIWFTNGEIFVVKTGPGNKRDGFLSISKSLVPKEALEARIEMSSLSSE